MFFVDLARDFIPFTIQGPQSAVAKAVVYTSLALALGLGIYTLVH